MRLLQVVLIAAMLLSTALASDGPVRHVVHFKFKAGADPAAVQRVVEEFALLKEKISAVESLEWGTDVSPEKLGKGFTHCWFLSFKNAADRDAYLVHPEHKAFVELLQPVLEDALVVDYIPQR